MGPSKPNRPFTPRDRVLTAIHQGRTDRIPKGELCIEDGVIRKELGLEKVGFEERYEFVNRLGLDIMCMNPVYPASKGGLPDAGELVWPDLEAWVHRSGLFTFALLDGAFGWGIKIFGFKAFLLLPVRDPGLLQEFIRGVEELNIRVAAMLIDQGVDGLIIAEDIAYRGGLLAGPEIVRRHFLPSLARQVGEMARGDRPIFFHSDGNLTEVMSDLVDMGFKGLHCIDRHSGMDISDLKHRYGEALCFWGTLAVEDVARSGDPSYREGLVEGLLSIGPNGGFIAGTTSGLFEG
ncbi:MAG: uroporphyrinogen decarboxylase family protein, partial [Pseudomonadota bacterium]